MHKMAFAHVFGPEKKNGFGPFSYKFFVCIRVGLFLDQLVTTEIRFFALKSKKEKVLDRGQNGLMCRQQQHQQSTREGKERKVYHACLGGVVGHNTFSPQLADHPLAHLGEKKHLSMAIVLILYHF